MRVCNSQFLLSEGLGQPIDIAHAAAFLLGDEAGYINGTSIVLDCGTRALPPWKGQPCARKNHI